MSWLSKLLGGGDQYEDAANIYRDYLSPYEKRGGRAGQILETEYGQMAQDPTALMNSLMGAYEPSKYYQFMQDRLGQAASNTAAAGGMRGSGQESLQQQELTQGLLSKDMQQFLQNALGIKGAGLSGEQSLYGTGYDAANKLASNLGQLKFLEGESNDLFNQQLLGSLMGAATGNPMMMAGMSSFFGGGSKPNPVEGNWYGPFAGL